HRGMTSNRWEYTERLSNLEQRPARAGDRSVHSHRIDGAPREPPAGAGVILPGNDVLAAVEVAFRRRAGQLRPPAVRAGAGMTAVHMTVGTLVLVGHLLTLGLNIRTARSGNEFSWQKFVSFGSGLLLILQY